ARAPLAGSLRCRELTRSPTTASTVHSPASTPPADSSRSRTRKRAPTPFLTNTTREFSKFSRQWTYYLESTTGEAFHTAKPLHRQRQRSIRSFRSTTICL